MPREEKKTEKPKKNEDNPFLPLVSIDEWKPPKELFEDIDKHLEGKKDK